MTELAGCVDPLELHLLGSTTRGVSEHGFAKRHNSLLDARNRALEHDEVVLDLAVADKATKTMIKLACALHMMEECEHTV